MASIKLDTYDSAEMISAIDAKTISGADIADVRKAIKSSKIEPVAELKTGKRGRPPKLYARQELLAAIAAVPPSVTVPAVASEVAKELEENQNDVADDEFDTAIA